MNRVIKVFLLSVLLFFLISNFLHADIVTTLSVQEGYNDNIFNDSLKIDDLYTSIGADVSSYPTSNTQFSAFARYNAYKSINDLSNFIGGVSITTIPTNDSSDFNLLLSGSFSKRMFGTLYEIYDNYNINGNTIIYYSLRDNIALKSSLLYNSTSYNNSSSVKDDSYGISGGLNMSFLGSNSLDFNISLFEKKYTSTLNYKNVSGNVISIDNSIKNSYSFLDFTLRYSRPVSQRLGMSWTLESQHLNTDNDYYISGYTIDYLSPWATLWDGQSVSLTLKYIMKNQVILESGASYFKKSYVDVLESATNNTYDYYMRSRVDKSTNFNLKISRQYNTRNFNFTPVLYANYNHNTSTMNLFEFDTFSITLLVKIKF